MKICGILWCVLISVTFARGQERTAQEISSEDTLILQEMCNSDQPIECLVGNANNPPEPPIFYKQNLKNCYERLRGHTFLWIDYKNFKKLHELRSATHLYVRQLEDSMLNLGNQRQTTALIKRKLVLLELKSESLKHVVITKGRVWNRQRLPQRKYELHYKMNIDNHQITIIDHRKICLDFGGYNKLQARGKIDKKELKSTLCYKSNEEVVIPKDLIKAKKFDKLTGRREIVISEVVVDIMVQKSDNVAFPITLKALMSEEKVAESTVRPKIKKY